MGRVVVREPNGRVLGVAYSSLDAGGRVVALDRIGSGKGRLLSYYFGEGNRAVDLEAGDFRLRGMLRTAWQGGERRWRVQVQPAMAPAGGLGGGGESPGRTGVAGR